MPRMRKRPMIVWLPGKLMQPLFFRHHHRRNLRENQPISSLRLKTSSWTPGRSKKQGVGRTYGGAKTDGVNVAATMPARSLFPCTEWHVACALIVQPWA